MNIVEKSFKMVMENPSITLFLVLFLIFSRFLGAYATSARTFVVSLMLLFSLFLLFGAFLSGWFQIIKESSCDKKEKEKNYGAIFLEGIGGNIISIGFGFFLLVLFLNLFLILAQLIAYKVFGSLDFLGNELSNLSMDADSLKNFLSTLSIDNQFTLYAWTLLEFGAITIFGFLFLFYMPAIIFNKKSNAFLKPIVAIWESICFVFKNFLNSFGIYILISILYFVLLILNAITLNNAILSILVLFVYIYFISFSVVLVFNYYGQKSDCADGCDCIRENEDIDKPSKEI